MLIQDETTNKKLLIKFLGQGILFFLAFFVFFFPKIVLAATYYVDDKLTSDCSAGNYSITSRDCSGSDGTAYNTVKEGISAAMAGDTINIREGNYNEYGISVNQGGASQTTIQAYNGEDVKIYKTANDPIRYTILRLGSSSNNILFKDIKFEAVKSVVITGWTNYTGNVWQVSFSYEPTEFQFDAVNSQSQQTSMASIDAPYEWYWSSSQKILYVYSPGDPAVVYINPGIAVIDDFDGIAIGNTSDSGSGFITIENCKFERFPHCGVKGSYRWWIKNCYFDDIGTDGHDHHIYAGGQFSSGNEAIIEYNYFGYAPGAAIHLYTDPTYHIVRYNIMNGTGQNGKVNFWGILLSGSNHQVYGNTIYGCYFGLMFFRNNCHNSIVKNNIFYGNTKADIIRDASPTNLVFENNYYGSARACDGCEDYSATGGQNYALYIAPPNIVAKNTNPFAGSPPTVWTDFKLKDGASGINNGQNIGEANKYAFDPDDMSWPPSVSSQSDYGTGWEMGAFVFKEAPQQDTTPPQAPTGVMVQ